MVATPGYQLLIKMWDDASGYETLGGQRVASLAGATEMIDVTNKTGTTRMRQLIEGGIQTFSITGSGIFDDTTRLKALRTKFLNGTIALFRLIDGNGDYFQGNFLVSTWNQSGENSDALTADFTLESAGDIEFVEV